MATYLATRCPQCMKWIPVRRCETDDPTFDPALFIQLDCPHCGGKVKLKAAAMEVVAESKLQSH